MLIQTERVLCSVPLTEYHRDDLTEYKGVFYLIHGHTGNQNNLGRMPGIFAAAGFMAVAIDAFQHGLRKAFPYTENDGILQTLAMPGVIKHTCEDIVSLQNEHYYQISSHVGVAGISMGGHIAFQMPKFLPSVEWIIPVIGTPDLYHHYHIGKKQFLGERIAFVDPLLAELAIPSLERYLDVNIFILGATKDGVVDYHYGKRFFEQLESMVHNHIQFYTEPVGHILSEGMADAIDVFAKTL
jgi:esterase/lipase